MNLLQNTTSREEFVSSKQPVNHTITIKDQDKFLLNNAAYEKVYWFIDCVYVGETDSLSFINNYTKENEKFQVEALFVASYEPVSLVFF